MGLVNVQNAFAAGGGISCMEDDVELDYDETLCTSIRPRTKAAATNRRTLLRAARQDDAPAMLQLVADGSDLTDVSEALRLAAFRGSASVVRELVAVGIGVNEACPDTGMTSLHLAAGSGHILVCELLLDAMADPCARGTPAINLARKKGHVEVEEVIERHVAAMLLAGKGEDPEDGGQYKRAHVLPRVSPVLSEAVMQALPALPEAQPQPSSDEPDVAAGCADGEEHSLPPGPLLPWPERPSVDAVLPL